MNESANRNWAGNLRYSTDRIFRPQHMHEVQHLAREHTRIKVLGTRHSFNDIADSNHCFISLERMRDVLELDREKRTVTIEAGIKYGELGEFLQSEGYALGNLASLPHISVAGACATATHGSGEKNGNLATAVVGMEMVLADGKVVNVRRETNNDFEGMVVSLGALGVITKLTLQIEPTFNVRQMVYRNLPLRHLEKHFDEIQSSGYSVSLFTDWQSDSINQVWLKKRVRNEESEKIEPDFFGAHAAPEDVHPIENISAENCTPQMGMRGAWHERLPHFRMGYTPSSGEELQAEYFVPRTHALSAIKAVASLREELGQVLMISEIRTIAADQLWLSPCYGRDSVAIHFTLQQKQREVDALLKKVEEKLVPFQARPHWGKLFAMPVERLRASYQRLDDFTELARRLDPTGKFRNAFLDRWIF